MARQVFTKLFPGRTTFLPLALLVVSACKLKVEPGGATGPSGSSNLQIAHFLQSLALLNSALDDFEGNRSYMGGTGCLKTFDCANTTATATNTYSSCRTPDNAVLTGSSLVEFKDQLSCEANQRGEIYTAQNTWMKKTFPVTLNRRLSSSQNIEVSGPGSIFATYLADGTRELSINPIDRKLSGIFNFQISTGQNLIFSGTRAAKNRRISSGRLQLRDSVSSYTYELNFLDVIWKSETCSYPTEGRMNSTVLGRGSESLSFTATCGIAMFSNIAGTEVSVSLQGASE